MQVIIGDNVEKTPQIFDVDETVPNAKRQKTMSPDYSPDPLQSTANKDLENLNPGDYTIARVGSTYGPSQAASIFSLGSSVHVSAKPSIKNGVSEYRAVEDTMNSSIKSRRRVDSSQPRLPMPSNHSDVPIEPSSSGSNPIDIPTDGRSEKSKKIYRPQPSYRGTARNVTKDSIARAGTIGPFKSRDTGERSRHFEAKNKLASQTHSQSAPISEGVDIAHRFRDTSGKRRSIDKGYSSDELVSENMTVVVESRSPARQMTPQPRSRRSSPAKYSSLAQNGTASADELDLPSSIVPQTKFSASGTRNRALKLSSYQNKYAQEKRAPWGVPLSGVLFAGQFKRSDGLGLQYDEKSQSYVVLDEGKSLTSQYRDLRIQPKKLLRAFWADSGGKIRFESSKSGNDDTKLDLEMHSDKGTRDLLAKLQEENDFDVMAQSRERIEKMFINHKLEQTKATRFSRPAVKEVPEDVQLASRHIERRDEANDQETSEQSSNKRPRTNHRIIDRLTGDNRQASIVQVTPRQSKTSSIFKDVLGDESVEAKNETTTAMDDALSRYDRLLTRTQGNNSHIPPSQIETRATLRKPKEPSPLLDEFPEEERYSRKFGLGLRWVKSLIYPKVGKKKTTVDWSDLERLDEGQYLNDNLIGFYLRFLEHRMEEKRPELQNKVYFFNTFFFASLTNTQRGKKPINYESVSKWTRGIDIFTYDYVVVPINESAHWYVAIICNLPRLVQVGPNPQEEIVALPRSGSEDGHEAPNERPAQPIAPVSRKTLVPEEPIMLDSRNNELEDPEPSASFADMSLQTDAEISLASERKDCKLDVTMADESKEDQEMLDAQLTENINESSALVDPGAPQVSEVKTERTETIIEDPSPRASLSKKRKRKSIPPIRTIDSTQPAIITFDSLGAPHPPTIRILKSYLREEGLAKRNGMEFDESRLKGTTAKQLPQQDNFSDCGLFLLGYMDKFLDNPKDFIEKVVKREYENKKDWPEMDPREMRKMLRKLIQKLHSEQEEERKREKMENAHRAGKFVGKKQRESEPEPSSDPLQTDEPNRYVAKVSASPDHITEAATNETDHQVATTLTGSKNIEITQLPLKTVQTRGEALESALLVDSQDPSEIKETPTEKSTNSEHTHSKISSLPPRIHKDASIIIIDSQPELQRSSHQTQDPESPIASPELATEIADSQPAEILSSPPTLPKSRHEDEEIWDGFDGLPALDPAMAKNMEELRDKIGRSIHDRPPNLGPAVGPEIEELRERPRRPKEEVRRMSVVEIDG